MRRRDFYALPRGLQDRFIESSQGVSVPKPLLVIAEAESESLRWAISAGVVALAWAGFVWFGFGDLESSFALGGPAHLAAHVGLGALLALCILRSFAISWEASRTPYGSGAFLFPSGVIHAKGKDLCEFDAADATSSKVEGAELVLVFPERTFRFKAADHDKAVAVLSAFEAGRKAWGSLAEGDSLERARLHPLRDSGVPNPLAPTDAYARPVLFPLPVLLLMACVGGATMGYAVSYWRTSLSEKALYAAAVERNSVAAFRAYLARGGDRAQVEELLLPRAELAEAMKDGSVEAIVEFEKRHRGSKIAAEVQGAIRSALLLQLEAAKKTGSLAAIDSVPKRHPDHASLISAEVAAARRDFTIAALARFQAKANPQNAELVPFLQHLLGYTERNGPTVEVRFGQKFSQDPKQLDSIVSKSKEYYLGRKLLPTQYFLGEKARKREAALGARVIERLSGAFSKEVLDFRLGAPPGGENEEAPPITVPTLVIEHAEKLSGGFVGGLPKGMYMGVALHMRATFHIPGSEQKLTFDFNAWRSPLFAILSDKDKDIPDVYEQMMDSAFAEFESKFIASWFKAP